MLLGIVLHVAGNYNTMPAGYIWPFKDTEVHGFFSGAVVFIHCFRMQVFFFVAGFFMLLLMEKRGTHAFIKNRTQRILIPFITLSPLIGYTCYVLFLKAAGIMAERGVTITFPDSLPLYHLWFLYYLILYYVVTLAVLRILQRLPARYIMPLLLLALGSIPLLQESYLMDTAYGFDIAWGTFFHYGIFFITGALAYREKDRFYAAVSRFRKPLAGLTIAIAGLVASLIFAARSGEDPEAVTWYGSLWLGISYFCLCWLIIGIYRKWMDKPSAASRYLADASYWMYLVHLPLAIAIPMALEPLPVNVFGKFSLSFFLILSLCLISYHFLVRPTWLGQLLNGRKTSLRRTAPELNNA